ncbi:MAG TPA: protein kinase [Anaerolineae bacterium]|nr:protein kinase [Anaerolineae bacterium]
MTTFAGQTLGKYQLVERMGRGGMADVYKGYQPGLDRYVAVKVLHPHLSEDPDFITRFRREARSVAELRHPYIVQVFDFDVQGENYYMVMEYVEGGKTLKQLLQELSARGERLPLDETLDLVAKLADALAYAHGLGMIHRDIKPANVLIPNLHRPVLGDFGIARLLGETGLTSSGQLVGTPAYMSPEQGRSERGDARSDIYALGIVLYEMLTGQPPYDADTPYAVILKHINDPLVPPHVLRAPMPDAVERIVLKCLAKNPDDRFASMAELREALRAARAGLKDRATIDVSASATATPQPRPLPPAAPAQPVPTKQPLQRPAWLPFAALIALIGVFGLLAVLLRGGGQAVVDASPPVGETPSASQPDEPSPARSEMAALVERGRRALFSGDLDAALEAFNQALAIEPDNPHALIGWAVAELARYGDTAAAAANLERAAQALPDDAFLHYGLGLLHIRSEEAADPQAAEAEFTQAIERCGNVRPLCSSAYYERSQVRAWNLGDVEGALADIDRAIEFYPDPASVHYLYASRSDLRYQAAGDAVGALDDLVTAYDLSNSGEYLEKAAALAVHIADYDRALGFYNRLLSEQRGDPHHLVGKGYVQWRSGDSGAAVVSAGRALRLNPDLLEAHYLLGLVALDRGRPQEALDQFQLFSQETDPDRLYQASFPFFQIEFGREIHYDMARAAHGQSDLEAALGFIEQSLQRDDYWPYPYIERGLILTEQGDLAGARENYLKALETVSDNPDLRASIEELLAGLTK